MFKFDTIINKHAAWLVGHPDGERCILDGTNISYNDMSGSDLRGAILKSVNLEGTDLRNIDLRGANLQGSKLIYTEMGMADMRGADLTSVDFTNALLTECIGWGYCGVDFRGARIDKSSLIWSDFGNIEGRIRPEMDDPDLLMNRIFFFDLRGSDYLLEFNDEWVTSRCDSTWLNECIQEHKKWLEGDTSSRPIKLHDQKLWGADIIRCNLSYSVLNKCDLFAADLDGCDFSYADLRGTSFVNTNLREANFEGALLDGANFTGANLSGSNIQICVSENINFSHVEK